MVNLSCACSSSLNSACAGTSPRQHCCQSKAERSKECPPQGCAEKADHSACAAAGPPGSPGAAVAAVHCDWRSLLELLFAQNAQQPVQTQPSIDRLCRQEHPSTYQMKLSEWAFLQPDVINRGGPESRTAVVFGLRAGISF
jgi:hypothetical protein